MLQSVFETSLVFVGGNVGEEEKTKIEGIIPVWANTAKKLFVCELGVVSCCLMNVYHKENLTKV